jgi:hypothetical protein
MPFSCLSSIRIFASAIYFCLRHLSPPQGTNRDEKKLNLELAGTLCFFSWSQNALLTASFSQNFCLRQAGAPEGAAGDNGGSRKRQRRQLAVVGKCIGGSRKRRRGGGRRRWRRRWRRQHSHSCSCRHHPRQCFVRRLWQQQKERVAFRGACSAQ